MSAAPLDIYQGATLRAVFEVTGDDDLPFSLAASGYTAARMQVRDKTTGEVQLDLSTDAGSIEIEPGSVLGTVRIIGSASATAAIDSAGRYDCLAWNPSDLTDVIVIAFGRTRVTERVTVAP